MKKEKEYVYQNYHICVGWLDNKIKFYRAKHGYTQEYLAELVGVSRNAISLIENRKFYPTYETIAKLLYVFDCKFEDLFDFEVHYV